MPLKSALSSFSAFFLLAVGGGLNQDNTAKAQLLGVERLGTFSDSAVFGPSAAEIVTFDEASGLLLVSNANTGAIDVVSIEDPTRPTLVKSLANKTGYSPNCVSVYNGLAAVALGAAGRVGNGTIAFYDMMTDSGTFLGDVPVCVLPDMLTFSPDGTMVVVACEGEPSSMYDIDPEGAVAVIDVPMGGNSIDGAVATIINLQEFDGREDDLNEMGVRIFGPGATASMDLEPEYIVVSADSRTAVVACQENNAFLRIDLVDRTVLDIRPIGFKDNSLPGNMFDASNRDGGINMGAWPTLGMYQPDGMTGFTIGGRQYYATANEGDSRDYPGYSEQGRIDDLVLSRDLNELVSDIQNDALLGRLTVSRVNATDDDGLINRIYAFGGRSFSIFDEDLNMIYESGSILEDIQAEHIPQMFNADNADNDSMDSRSDNKGPEPEAVVYANIRGHDYLFVLLERPSVVAVFNIADPAAPVFESIFHNRIWSGNPVLGTAGDLGPESGVFIPEQDSPTGDPLLAVANEVSGTTTIYRLIAPPGEEPPQGGGDDDNNNNNNSNNGPNANMLRVDIWYDDSPEETSWVLINRDTNDPIHASQEGTVTTPGRRSEIIDGVPDGNYYLFVLDSGRNGISNESNNNAIEIYRLADTTGNNNNNGGELLAASSGDFGSLANLAVSLP